MNYGFKDYLKNKELETNYLDKKKKDIIIKKVENEIDQLRAKYLVDKRNHNERNISNFDKEIEADSTKIVKNDYINLLENDNSDVISNEDYNIKDNEYSSNKKNKEDNNIFDRAKENLLKLKDDLNELDQYEVKNMRNYNDSISEEEPKNLENEISHKSFRESVNKNEDRGRSEYTCEYEKKMDPYFKKMINKYNPKYKREEISKERFEKIKSEVYEKFEREHTFKPQINYNFSSHNRNEESRDDFYRRLSTPKIQILNKREKEKSLYDEKKFNIECPFKPNIEKKDRPKESEKEQISTRLYKLSEQMREKREKLKREYQENQLNNCSFTPKIDETSKQLMLKYEKRPIYERYDEEVESKKTHLQYLRSQKEKCEKNFYKPKISSKSKEIVNRNTNRSFNDDTYERLYRQANKKKNIINDSEMQECTFSPQLFYSTTNGNIDDFLERQKIYDDIRKERLERKLSKSIEDSKYTFSPQINLTSDILIKADTNRINENKDERINRLYKTNYDKIKSRKQQLENFYYAQYDFKPKINEISRLVGKDHNIEDLTKVKPKRPITPVNIEEYSFKPNLNKNKFENVQSNYKLDNNISERIQNELKNKNEKIEELKSVLEEKEFNDYSFKPDINKELPNFDKKEPIVIKGFAKYLDQMEKARKAKREKEEREKEVFISGENWSRDNLFTIPKPFKLSYQVVDNKKKEDMIKKNKENELKECTFKPTTNESKNKEIIKMLLKN